MVFFCNKWFQELVELIRTKKLAQAAAASAKKNWQSWLDLVVKPVQELSRIIVAACTKECGHMRVFPTGADPCMGRLSAPSYLLIDQKLGLVISARYSLPRTLGWAIMFVKPLSFGLSFCIKMNKRFSPSRTDPTRGAALSWTPRPPS